MAAWKQRNIAPKVPSAQPASRGDGYETELNERKKLMSTESHAPAEPVAEPREGGFVWDPVRGKH
jgi:hypothetical protein